MLIANPIYDTVFKRLMENRRIARFFIETLIGEQVEDIAMVPQEYTYRTNEKITEQKTEIAQDGREENAVVLSIVRHDFVAAIRTAGGENKKVLIEIQKSSKPADLLRFRTYLGEQYKRADMIEAASGKVEKGLPIITIYLLGFTLPEIKSPAIRVNRTYIDMIEQKEIKQKSDWIESLTHDGYFVQIPLVKGKPRSSLEKALSVFEQQYFFDDKKTIKEYDYPIDDENVKTMVEVLRHAAADARTKREMEEAWWAELNEKEYERMAEFKDKIIAEKDKSLAEKDKEIAELRKRLGE